MPDIAVTPDQRERLRWIQRRLEEDIAYGHVRPCDALDYLLDHAEATDGLKDFDAERAAAAPTSPGGDGHGNQAPSEGGLADENALNGDEESAEGAANGVVADAAEDTPSETADADSASDAATADTAEADAPKPNAANGNGASTLNSMMQLLETHDDKWREASVGDEKYEVDLPDGSTEPARTKDDVRALLFKHHR